jgi:hypothetical protein
VEPEEPIDRVPLEAEAAEAGVETPSAGRGHREQVAVGGESTQMGIFHLSKFVILKRPKVVYMYCDAEYALLQLRKNTAVSYNGRFMIKLWIFLKNPVKRARIHQDTPFMGL